MFSEKGSTPPEATGEPTGEETEPTEEIVVVEIETFELKAIEGEKLREHMRTMKEQINGLREALAGNNLPEEDREEFEEQLEALEFAFEEIDKGAPLTRID